MVRLIKGSYASSSGTDLRGLTSASADDKRICVAPLEGRNAGWINNALESAIEQHGTPKHIVSDQAHVFTGNVFAELLKQWKIKPRLGAVGKHGSIDYYSDCTPLVA